MTTLRMIPISLAIVLAMGGAVQASAQEFQTTGDQEINLQAYAELLREDVRAQKMTIITQMMGFTPDEASRFWPVYADYDRELSALGDERVALIEDYAASYQSMTDQRATELANRALDLEASRTVLKRQYFERFREALSGRAAARFLQVENQLLMLIDLQIASSLPVVQ